MGIAVDCDDSARYREVDPCVESRGRVLISELDDYVAGSHPVARYRLELGGLISNELVQSGCVRKSTKRNLNWSLHKLLSSNSCVALHADHSFI